MSRTSLHPETPRLARVLIAAVALANAAFFIAYQSADWTTYWTDQNGYLNLGQALAQTGRFTRYPSYPVFVPEVIRTPGYPLFVAAVNLTLGQGHLPVAIAQAFVFAILCLLAYEIARLYGSDRLALGAGLTTALYPTLPYFAALTLTDLFTTFLVTAGVYAWLRALRDGGGWTAAAGVALGATALTRPSFQLLPIAFVIGATLVAPRTRTAFRRGLLMLAVFVLTLAPWMVYMATYFHTVSISPPAAGIGRTLWEGAWQIAFPGRVQAALTHLAETTWDRTLLDASVRELARTSGLDPAPMLRYVHEWQDMRRMWDDPKEPPARAAARAAADGEYGRLARARIREDPIRHVALRLVRGIPLLWVTEIPVRYSDINALPTFVIRAIWLAQGVLMAVALGGLVVLWRRGERAAAVAFGSLLAYVTAVHVVLYSEARYAMPAKPVVLVLTVLGVQATALSVTDRGQQGRSKGTQALGRGRPLG